MQILANLLPWIQIILSAVLVVAILLQHSGAEVGGALGGGDGGFHHTKRGFEKFLFIFSITVSILFALSSVIAIFI